jgi:hypothetical protein
MFIKVVGEPATLFQIPAGPNGLEYGSKVVYSEPWTVDWQQELETAFTFLHYRGGNIPGYPPPPNQVDGEFVPAIGGDTYWIAHWARWSDPDRGTYGVVTTESLYVLNDNGKTIDSLRHG